MLLRNLLLIVLCCHGLLAQAETVALHTTSNVGTLHVGDTFSVNVTGEDFGSPVVGGAFALSYDPGVLALTAWSADQNVWTLGGGKSSVTGDYYFNAFSLTGAFPRGSLLIGELQFKVVGSGTTSVALADPTLNWATIGGKAYPSQEQIQYGALAVNVGQASVQAPASVALVVEQGGQQQHTMALTNPGGTPLTVHLEAANPHAPDLKLTLSPADSVTLAAGETKTINLTAQAAGIAVGRYEDMLVKLSVVDGDTLYSNVTVTVAQAGQAALPDLALRSRDIQLGAYVIGTTATLTAAVHNAGTSAANNVKVQFYQLGTLLGETTLASVPAQGLATATFSTAAIATAGAHLIQVVVDAANLVAELDESNNQASTIVEVATPAPQAGGIFVSGNLPTTVYANAFFALAGDARYDITQGGVHYTNYPVKGGAVQITLTDTAGHDWVYGDVHTDINGHISKTLQAPATPGTYRIYMTITDKTFSGTRELAFSVVEPPAAGPPPPVPPCNCLGSWTYVPISGGWIWTPSPGQPQPQTDLWVFSEDIYFSNNRPNASDEITLFAEIHYWANSTSLIAKDIPINVYVTYPGQPKQKVGQTVIANLSVASPDFGSRYVYASWKNQGEGIYIVEFEIDPSYMEAQMVNNAATRAIIVGEGQFQFGAISGRVTGDLGPVGNVILQLTDSAGLALGSTATDETGAYRFNDLPLGDMVVHVGTPSGYRVDAENKGATVRNAEVSVVDFYLSQAFARCDLNQDGKVDRTDITRIFTARGQNRPGDARDIDGDGWITVNDARACTLVCTNKNCASSPPL